MILQDLCPQNRPSQHVKFSPLVQLFYSIHSKIHPTAAACEHVRKIRHCSAYGEARAVPVSPLHVLIRPRGRV